jgi:hypothetical protein
MKFINSRQLQGISLAIALGILPGCVPASQSPPVLETKPITVAPPSPVASSSPAAPAAPSVAPSPIQSPISSTVLPSPLPQKTSSLRPDPNNPDILRDYDTMSPLPETGRVTVRSDINSLDTARLIVDCPTDTAPYAYAESSNYRIQICSEEYDPWIPKYYIGRAKEGGTELRLINKNVAEARQLIFRNGDYMYTIYRDGARPDRMNAYLEIYSPDDRKTYAEALLYLYEKSGQP